MVVEKAYASFPRFVSSRWRDDRAGRRVRWARSMARIGVLQMAMCLRHRKELGWENTEIDVGQGSKRYDGNMYLTIFRPDHSSLKGPIL